jgi:LacI family transcriptional regulator
VSTILDVARLAEVSIATVSRVINGEAAVRPQTRRLVEVAIEQLDYRPNAAARSLRLSRSRTLGLIVTDVGNPVFAQIVNGIESVAREHDYSLFLCNTGNEPDAENRHLERLYERRVDGVILYSINGCKGDALGRFLAAKSPVVAMGPAAFRGDVPGVLVREKAATEAALRRLLALGHTRIAMIDRDTPRGRFVFRTRAVRQVLAAAGIPWDSSLLVHAEGAEDCRANAAALLTRPDRPTAVLIYAMEHTPFVLQSVYDAGLRIPDDVSIVAYGDSPWACAHRPPLSVVRVDYNAWGRESAELLLRRIDAPEEAPPRIARNSEFIDRESLAPPPIRVGR